MKWKFSHQDYTPASGVSKPTGEKRKPPSQAAALQLIFLVFNVDQVKRGDVITFPGTYQPSRRIDVRFRLLPDISQPLKHDTLVKFFLGAAEIQSRVRLLGSEELLPAEEGWLQLELDEPVVAIRGDRYILRRPSPGETLGGGTVVDPHPKGRHKRFSAQELANLDTLARGTPAEILLQSMLALGIATLQDVITRSNLDASTANQAIQELVVKWRNHRYWKTENRIQFLLKL